MAALAKQKFVSMVVRHYLKYDRENPFIFISALMAFLGIAAGVMVMIIAMAITNGIQKEFKEKLFVMNYPLTVVSYTNGVDKSLIEKIHSKYPDLKLSPYYVTQAISKNDTDIQGSMIYGVDFDKEAAINKIFKQAISDSNKSRKYSIVIGDALASEMMAKKGDKILLYFSKQQPVGFGTVPLQKRFKVAGIFKSGLQAYDKGIAYTTQKALRSLLKKDSNIFDGIHIYCNNPMQMKTKIAAMLPDGVNIEGWWQQNGNFFTAMEMEKKVYFLVLLFIILIASLNIISSLLMTVMSRRSEIALMRTLGAGKREISAIFYRLGLIIGSMGIVAGTILGFIGMWLLKNFDIITLPADVYGSTKLPVDLPLSNLILIIAGAAIIVLVSSIYPAKKASSTDPLKVLRNE